MAAPAAVVRVALVPVKVPPSVPVTVVAVPARVWVVNATVAIVTLAPADEVWKWLRLLIGFDVVLVTTCTLVFPFAVET